MTIVSRERIKPSSPTPSKLSTYNLSGLDLFSPKAYMPFLLFYPNNINYNLTNHEKAMVLKTSLSHSLTRYYPFAGRLHTPTSPYIDCNDEGVVFIESRNDSKLETFQNMTEQDETMDQLFADGMVWYKSPHSTNLVWVQLNHFSCGGVAVAISMSHVIGDGCTLASFVSYWALVARYGSTTHKEIFSLDPYIIHFPRINVNQTETHDMRKTNVVSKKFVFPNSKLSHLKNMVSLGEAGSTSPINNPTRVEILTSILYKTAIVAASKKFGCSKPSYLLIVANIRNKLVQKLPQATIENLCSTMIVTTRQTSETSLSMMVEEIRKEKVKLEGLQTVEHAVENIKSALHNICNGDLENFGKQSYVCSSLCGFQFNTIDFGWGKPVAANLTLRSLGNTGFVLMDSVNGDGIEALVMLEKECMEIFENDKEMLSFSKINQV